MLFATAAMPKDIVNKLHLEMTRLMSDADMRHKASIIGLLPINPPSIAETEKYLSSEREKWGALVRKLGLEGSQ